MAAAQKVLVVALQQLPAELLGPLGQAAGRFCPLAEAAHRVHVAGEAQERAPAQHAAPGPALAGVPEPGRVDAHEGDAGARAAARLALGAGKLLERPEVALPHLAALPLVAQPQDAVSGWADEAAQPTLVGQNLRLAELEERG
jgi:hypothetical protein